MQGLLGAVGWALFAVGWARPKNVPLGPPEPAPVAAQPAVPRKRIPRRSVVVLAVVAVAAAIPMALAWWVESVERALLAHAVSLAAAIALVAFAADLFDPRARQIERAAVLVRPEKRPVAAAAPALIALVAVALAGAAYGLLEVELAAAFSMGRLLNLLAVALLLGAALACSLGVRSLESRGRWFRALLARGRCPIAEGLGIRSHPPAEGQMKRLLALFLVGAWAGCSSPLATKSSPGPSSSALPAGIVATVGSLAVPRRGRRLGCENAADSPSPGGRCRSARCTALPRRPSGGAGYEDVSEVRAALRGRLARARLEILQQQVAAAPIADAEVEEATAPHFVQLARPEAFRVIHAVVLVTEKAAPDDRGEGQGARRTNRRARGGGARRR